MSASSASFAKRPPNLEFFLVGRQRGKEKIFSARVRAFEHCGQYIRQNPVKRGLALFPEEYPYSSVRTGLVLDAVPQRLKPSELIA